MYVPAVLPHCYELEGKVAIPDDDQLLIRPEKSERGVVDPLDVLRGGEFALQDCRLRFSGDARYRRVVRTDDRYGAFGSGRSGRGDLL